MPHKNDIKLDRWQHQQWKNVDLSNATEIHIDSSGIDLYKQRKIYNPEVKLQMKIGGMGLDECADLICGELQSDQRRFNFAYRLSVDGKLLIVDASLLSYEFEFEQDFVLATLVLQGHMPPSSRLFV